MTVVKGAGAGTTVGDEMAVVKGAGAGTTVGDDAAAAFLVVFLTVSLTCLIAV